MKAAAGILLLTAAFASGASGAFVQEEFMIGTFWDPRLGLADSTRDEDLLQLSILREAGFNLMSGANDDPNGWIENTRKLDLVSLTPGLRTMIADPRYWDAKHRAFDSASAAGVLKQYGRTGPGALTPAQRSAFYGYLVSDEPSPSALTPATRLGEVDNVIRWKDFLQSGDPARFAWVNLLPYVRSPSHFRDTGEYKEYIARFLGDSSVKVASFDYYPFLKGGGWSRYDAEAPYYYRTLGWFAEQIRQGPAGRAFWAFVMCSEHPPYAPTTLENLRLMAFAPLLYGAKGLMYFTYAQPRAGGKPLSEYRTYLADSLGRPFQPNYEQVRTVNRQVALFGKVLMGLEWQAAIHGGYSRDPPYTVKDPESGEPGLPSAASAAGRQDALTSQQPGLGRAGAVGVFRNPATGEEHLLVLNKDRRRSHAWRLEARGARTAYRHRPDAEAWEPLPTAYVGRTGTTRIDLPPLPPGGLELIRLHPSPPRKPVTATPKGAASGAEPDSAGH